MNISEMQRFFLLDKEFFRLLIKPKLVYRFSPPEGADDVKRLLLSAFDFGVVMVK